MSVSDQSAPRVAFYGDDFTGSVDALLQFARRGWSGRLFVGVPAADDLADAASTSDVVGIAGIARSLDRDALERELRPAFAALAETHAPIVQYKACSTADSSPTIGSLGRVIELGRELVADRTVPALFAQPDFGRFTAFGTHFAAEDGVVHRLDRQPTMSKHPSTPMTEADLAQHLRAQTDLSVGNVTLPVYAGGAASIAEAINTSDAGAVVLDALDDTHLTLVGVALLADDTPRFVVGSGGLSHGIAAADPGAAGDIPTSTGRSGPVLAVSGSRSPRSRRQADAAAAAGWLVRPLTLAGESGSEDVLQALATGRSVALTSDDADTGDLTAADVLPAIARAAAQVVDAALRAGTPARIIVAGGDTSSRVVTLLGITSLSIAANPWANVVLLRAHAPDPAIDGAELLLKGGQVGDDTLYEHIRTLP